MDAPMEEFFAVGDGFKEGSRDVGFSEGISVAVLAADGDEVEGSVGDPGWWGMWEAFANG